MRLRKVFLLAAAAIVSLSGVAIAAVPGPQRFLFPGAIGLTEIAAGVFTDQPATAHQQLAMISVARGKVGDFFGTIHTTPRVILCSTAECAHKFGESGNVAKSLGWSALFIPKKAFDDPVIGQVLMTHEMIHSELLYRWGTTALWDKRIPNWFNEGLASYISGDPRISLSASSEDKAWIRQSVTFWDWNSFVNKRDWSAAYGAAASLVSDINRKLGRAGMRQLIDRSLNGEHFDDVLHEMAGI